MEAACPANWVDAMTVIVGLPPEVEAGLAAIAAEQGVSVSEYIRRLLQEQVSGRGRMMLSPAERAADWRESVKDLPPTPPPSAAVISRESIYDARG
jgi:hypothetical protein